MSAFHDFDCGQSKTLPFDGKTIQSFRVGKDSSGYDFVLIIFTDGTAFEANEIGQCGEMDFEIWNLAVV